MNIKELTTIEQMEEVQQLERKVWGIETIPTHQTLTAVKNGGIIVGAYDQQQLIGFSYGFAGFQNGRAFLCSHMLGIDTTYRSQQIGEKLKLAQRDIAIEKGYTQMHWTYDPLETRNGYLNLTKLNGICDTYIENCYGEMQDGFNKGLPSDRFEVHWYLTSDYVTQQLQPALKNAVAIGSVSLNSDGLPTLTLAQHVAQAEAYSLPVPFDFQALKARDAELALKWRLQTREVCQRLFAQGYAAVRLEKHVDMNAYLFVKKETLPLGGNEHENY